MAQLLQEHTACLQLTGTNVRKQNPQILLLGNSGNVSKLRLRNVRADFGKLISIVMRLVIERAMSLINCTREFSYTDFLRVTGQWHKLYFRNLYCKQNITLHLLAASSPHLPKATAAEKLLFASKCFLEKLDNLYQGKSYGTSSHEHFEYTF